MKLLIRVVIFIVCLIYIACKSEQPASSIEELEQQLAQTKDTTEMNQIYDAFEKENPNFPILEDGMATFVYKGRAEKVRIAGDFTNWRPSNKVFKKMGNSDIWYLKLPFENTARLDYKLVVNESEWILDPKNPHQIPGGWGPNSELRMPDYKPAWELDGSNISEKGEISEMSIHSTILNKAYPLYIYFPPNYDSSENKAYPVIYLQDGRDNINLGSLPTVLDNLINQKKIVPLIAVCIGPNNRESEYVTHEKEQYRNFFISELIPFIDDQFYTIKSPDARAVIGASYGANISAQIAFLHTDVVSKCGVHSAAYQPENNKTKNLILENLSSAVDYVAIWGSYESVYTHNRNIRSAYEKAGLDHVFIEFPEGHSWGLWRATYDEILIRFFPYSE